MKKSISALMGLFALVACSEDTYQEADKMTETGGVENSGPQNSIKTNDPSIPYQSPYDMNFEKKIRYIFKNNTDVELKFHSFVSLCYFDGQNDGTHFGHVLGSGAYPVFTILSNWNEYQTQVTAKQIIIPPYTTEIIDTVPGMTLPADPAGPKTASGQFFEFGTGAVPTTPAEIKLFSQFGKFIGLESNMGTIQFKFLPTGGIPGSMWQNVPLFIPTMKKAFHNTTKEICPITGGVASYPTTSTKIINGVTYTLRAYTDLNSVIVELN